MPDGDDVLDYPRGGKCPRCGADLHPPEVDPEEGTLAPGEENYWCPGCGYVWPDDEEELDG